MKKSDIVLSVNYAVACTDHRGGPLPWAQQCLPPLQLIPSPAQPQCTLWSISTAFPGSHFLPPSHRPSLCAQSSQPGCFHQEIPGDGAVDNWSRFGAAGSALAGAGAQRVHLHVPTSLLLFHSCFLLNTDNAALFARSNYVLLCRRLN